MKLHLLSVPHCITRADFSHDPYAMKVRLFAPMMRPLGFHVVHYGVAGAESGANEQVDLMGQDEHLRLLGQRAYHESTAERSGPASDYNSSLYTTFNAALKVALLAHVAPGDIICLPRGNAHDDATRDLPGIRSGEIMRIETGIGYPKPATFTRVYESEAWRHWILGSEMREGMGWETPRLEWVIPNYYNVEEWPLHRELADEEHQRVVFLGRLNEMKGLSLIPKLAKARPDLWFVICGQGDPTPYLTQPNIEYRPPISGTARAAYLAGARCAIFPSRFVEPFCGAAVEAMLCGTPVLTSDFGAFTETVIDGINGFRCRTAADFIARLDDVLDLDRGVVHTQAQLRYSTNVVGPKYERVFTALAEHMDETRRKRAALTSRG